MGALLYIYILLYIIKQAEDSQQTVSSEGFFEDTLNAIFAVSSFKLSTSTIYAIGLTFISVSLSVESSFSATSLMGEAQSRKLTLCLRPPFKISLPYISRLKGLVNPND